MITLFEYDKPVDITALTWYEAGIPFYQMTPIAHTVTDDYAITGYYEDTNDIKYTIKSARVNGTALSVTTSISDLILTEDSFYYDGSNYIYFRMKDFEPFTLETQLYVGVAVGYSKGADDPVYNGVFYPPLLQKVPTIKKSIDPLFFGMLKYQSVSPQFDNLPCPPVRVGEFDDWRTRNAWGQAVRVIVNETDNVYANFTPIISGFIEDDKTDFNSFSVKLQDLRKSLTQAVATRKYTKTEYPYLDDNDVDKVKPVAYGSNYYCPTVCTNKTQSTSTYYFHFVDTYYNAPTTGYVIYTKIDNIYTAVTGSATMTLSGGYFTLPSSICAPDGDVIDVFISFDVISAGVDGVSIIKDLMYRYNGLPFIASFWDTTEVNLVTTARDTSIYIDDDAALSKAIESVCVDCDLRFFVKRDGRYTIRIYDPLRSSTRQINSNDWMDYPSTANNGSQYLTSCIIKYKPNRDSKSFRTYDSTELLNGTTTYSEQAFAEYKTYKSKTFETNLTSLSDAIDKATTIMSLSYYVTDIVTRSLPWEYSDIEICDFITASPSTRSGSIDVWGVYEVTEVSLDIDKKQVSLSMRYVQGYTPIVYQQKYRELGNNDLREMGNGDVRITNEVVI
jgi:hypothetical protein